MSDLALRAQLAAALDWQAAHATFAAAVEGIPPEMRGRQAQGLPYSPWQLVEHLRITQRDILDFCRDPKYQEIRWPDDYWPSSIEPPSPTAWDDAITAYHADLDALKALASDEGVDLFARIPHGTGQTYLRELLLVADHTAYHVGQLVLVRRLLGIWGG
ncbi:MAG TPA: DinB family protein [Longimicrobium sp.]